MKTSRFGFLLAFSYAAGAVVYLGLVIVSAFDGRFPPIEPYQALISVITYLFIPVQVLIWVSIHQLTRPEKQVFSLGSLADKDDCRGKQGKPNDGWYDNCGLCDSFHGSCSFLST